MVSKTYFGQKALFMFWREMPCTICVGLLCLLVLWLRWPSAAIDTFSDEEVASITYGADLLRHGLVPMVHSVETKAPLASFATWAIWGVAGRNLAALESFGLFWALLAALGVFWLGRRLFGLAGGMIAGIVFAIGSPILDGMALGYYAWTLTPFIWSSVFFVEGLRSGNLGWFVGCGILVSISALFKHQGALIAPFYALILVFDAHLKRPDDWRAAKKNAPLFYLIGVVLGFLPVVLYYAIKGGLVSFIYQFFFSYSGWESLAGEGNWNAKLLRLFDGFNGLWEFLAIPTLLACLSFVSLPLRRHGVWTLMNAFLVSHFLVGAFCLVLGFRFVESHYLLLLPVMAWLAGHPDGLFLRWFNTKWPSGFKGWLRGALIFCLLVGLTPPVFPHIKKINDLKRNRYSSKSLQIEAKTIARVIRKNTDAQTKIWVWGQPAWSVYFYADRLSASRYYKSLGIITNQPANTWRRSATTYFVRKGPWHVISKDLARTKPRFVVLTKAQSALGWNELDSLM
ncbi:MAG: glycosyltransferase family 39 protein, partial [Pseudomonadota bacterium]